MSNEELTKRKLELEVRKLELETGAFEANRRLDRTKLWIDNIKWGLAIAATAYLGYHFNGRLEQQKAGHTFTQKEQDAYNQQFTNCMNKDAVAKADCACGLKAIDPPFDPDLATKKKEVAEKLCEEKDALAQATESAEQVREAADMQDKKAAADAAERIAQAKRMELQLATTEVEKQRLQSELQRAETHQDSLLAATPALLRAANSAISYEKSVQSVGQAVGSISTGRQAPLYRSDVTWVKVGYFLLMGPSRDFKIFLKNLGTSRVVIAISHVKPDRSLKPIEENAVVRFGEPKEFKYEGHTYRINLESIGPAGKNPFTKAAYITFETLN